MARRYITIDYDTDLYNVVIEAERNKSLHRPKPRNRRIEGIKSRESLFVGVVWNQVVRLRMEGR